MENTVDFVPKVYKRKDVQSVLDRAFREFGQIEEEQGSKTSIEQFFRSYEDLYYLIPATGSVNSHQYLVEKSSELYTPEQAAVDIQPLLDEITLLRSQSVSDQQTIISLQTELANIRASATGNSI